MEIKRIISIISFLAYTFIISKEKLKDRQKCYNHNHTFRGVTDCFRGNSNNMLYFALYRKLVHNSNFLYYNTLISKNGPNLTVHNKNYQSYVELNETQRPLIVMCFSMCGSFPLEVAEIPKNIINEKKNLITHFVDSTRVKESRRKTYNLSNIIKKNNSHQIMNCQNMRDLQKYKETTCNPFHMLNNEGSILLSIYKI
ncbi:hypothetical protein PMLGA01_130010600, partial [Plasmodium malariae]